ncbi:MAG: hypothetical protein ACR2FG_05940 [Marmoricola sp.]
MSELTPSPNRVKVGHLVVGLVFLGLALSWALRAGGVTDSWSIGLLVPVVLVGAGAVGLVAMLAGGVRRNRTDPSDEVDINYKEDLQ